MLINFFKFLHDAYALQKTISQPTFILCDSFIYAFILWWTVRSKRILNRETITRNPIAAPRERLLEIQPLVPRKLRTRQILSTMSTKKSSAGGLTRLCTNSPQFHIHVNYKVRIFFDLLSFFLAHHRQNSWHCFSPDFHTPIIVLDRMVTLSHNYSSGIAWRR